MGNILQNSGFLSSVINSFMSCLGLQNDSVKTADEEGYSTNSIEVS